jgi:hypothetical protein
VRHAVCPYIYYIPSTLQRTKGHTTDTGPYEDSRYLKQRRYYESKLKRSISLNMRFKLNTLSIDWSRKTGMMRANYCGQSG